MKEYITFEELRTVLTTVYEYQKTKNIELLKPIQELIKTAKEIDYSIKTLTELDTNQEFLEYTHGPQRMAVFLLNYYGEMYLNNATITIYNDDPREVKNSHRNTYILKLKDEDSHKALYRGNPSPESKPYDFDTKFVKQITQYPDNVTDTTGTAWDSFANCYTKPSRTIDFKSALWTTGKHTHFANYIIKLDTDKKVKLFFTKTSEEKQFNLVIADGCQSYAGKYYTLLNILNSFTPLIWDQFILED